MFKKILFLFLNSTNACGKLCILATMILVTGGTGLVGAHLLFSLLQKGEKVRAIHRKNSNLNRVKSLFEVLGKASLYDKIEWKEANLIDIPQLSEAFQDINKVYHAAAYVSFNPKHYQKLVKSNVEGTANIVNLSLHFGVEKLCYFSSVATLSPIPGNEMIDEECFWNAEEDSSVYAITKYAAEMEVWRGTQEGLKSVILNPGIILGSGFWNSGTGAFFSRIHKNLNYYPTGVTGFVAVEDVVCIAEKLMKSTIENERFVIVAENRSFHDIFSLIATALNKKPPQKPLQPWLLQFLWRLDKMRSIITFSKPQLFKSTAKAASRKRYFSNQKVAEKLQFSFTKLEKSINRIAKDYITQSKNT